MGDVLLIARVEVTPPSATLSPQETVQLEATPKTEGGIVLPSRDVSWTSSAPGIATVSSTGLVTAISAGGPVTMRATIEGVEGQAAITVNPIAVAQVSVAPSQASIVVGASVQLTATAYDAGGTVLPGRSFLWESSAPQTAAVTTTGLVIGQAIGGPAIITATSGGKSSGAAITVTSRPATRLGFLQQPTSTVAGQPITPALRVAIQDDLLGTVPNATNNVTIALAGNPGGATLSGTTTVAAVSGVATFNNLSLDRAGTSYTLSASSSGLAPATSTPFNVTAGSANRLSFTTAPPSGAQSGVPLSPQPALQVRDAAGNPVAQAGIVITASISSGSGSLGGSTTATTSSSGSATFANLSLSGPIGSYTIAFSAPGMIPVTSGTIALTAGVPAVLSIQTQPSNAAQSGVPLAQQPVLQLKDAAGNAVAQSGVAVSAAIASGPSGATLGGSTVVTSDGAGAARFANLSLSGPAGSYTLAFASSGLSGATSNTIVLSAGGGTSLAIITQPSSTVANGVSFPQQPVLQLKDAAGNPVAQAGILVTASIQTGGGLLGGTATIATNSAGTASFTNLSITGSVGNRTLLFAAPGYVGVSSATISVTAGGATQLSISTQPSSSVASGAVFPQQPVLLVQDASNNPVSGVVVTAVVASGGGTLGGTATATSNANGLASYTNLSLTGSGNQTLGFSIPGGISVVSGTITLPAGPPAQLTLATQPSSSVQSGVAFPQQPAALVQDSSGNPVSGVVVTVAIASGGGALSGTLTATSGANGTATFTNLALSGTTGIRTLRFSATGLPAAISNSVSVTAGAPATLTLTTQPSGSVQSGVAFPQQPVLLVVDAWNNPVSGVVVTAAIASGGGTLGGTLTATTSASGAASFSNLAISGTIGIRTLSFAATGVTAVVSNNIDVKPGPASQLSITTQPSSLALAGVNFTQQPVIQLLDAAGNAVSKSGVAVTAAINSSNSTGTLGGTLVINTNGSGVAPYSNLRISTAGSYTLKFTSPGLTQVVSITITVN